MFYGAGFWWDSRIGWMMLKVRVNSLVTYLVGWICSCIVSFMDFNKIPGTHRNVAKAAPKNL
jgi:hypothetical protein